MKYLLILSVLFVGCVHQQKSFELVEEHEVVPPAGDTPVVAPEDGEELPVDLGGGGYIPPVPYYLATETMSQAAQPVDAASAAFQAYSLTLTAPSGANALTFANPGARLFLGGFNGNYLESYANADSVCVGSCATPYTALQAAGIYSINAGLYVRNGIVANDAAGQPLTSNDTEGFRLSSTAALPTCAAALEGTFKRDGTTGAASSLARTRMCLCTSDGLVTPSYAWQNVTSGTVGTATTCGL